MGGTGYCPDFSVLKNHAFALALSRDGSIYHCPHQVVRWNYLVGGQPPKDGVNGAQKPVTEIRFLPRLHGIDVGGICQDDGTPPPTAPSRPLLCSVRRAPGCALFGRPPCRAQE